MAVEGFFFDNAPRVIDRRNQPSHGYRAVHVVVTVREYAVEIQLRTVLQDQWASLCEKLSDALGADISTSSELVAKIERDEEMLFMYRAELDSKPPDAAPTLRSLVDEFGHMVEQRRAELSANLQRSIALVRCDKLNGGTH